MAALWEQNMESADSSVDKPAPHFPTDLVLVAKIPRAFASSSVKWGWKEDLSDGVGLRIKQNNECESILWNGRCFLMLTMNRNVYYYSTGCFSKKVQKPWLPLA